MTRPEVSEDVRREALSQLADTPEKRAKLLMQLAKNQLFDPDNTASAITPLLLELPAEAVFSINDDLDKLIAGNNAAMQSTALSLKIRSGASIGTLAKSNPDAVVQAIAKLPAEQAPDGLDQQLLTLAEEGTLDAELAMVQAARLTKNVDQFFERVVANVDVVKEDDYTQWGPGHKIAMASLAVMNSIDHAKWPAGYDAYHIPSGDTIVLGQDEATKEPITLISLGHELYYEEEKGCVKCHGHHGEGTEGFPPLAGSPTLLGDPLRAATIVKHGLKGELAHTLNPSDGKPYNAQMEPLSYFSDAEIAAAVTYARQHFGNYASPVTPKQVAATRSSADGLMWDVSALLAKYPFERDRVTGPLPPPSISVKHWTPPAAGLIMMLGAVTLCMLFILVITYAGKFMQNSHPAHTPAH